MAAKNRFFANNLRTHWDIFKVLMEYFQVRYSILNIKSWFSVVILNFYDQTGSRFFEPIFFTNHDYRTWKYCIRILKIYQLVLKLSTKNRFPVAIMTFYDKPEVDFSNPYFVTNHVYRTWKYSIRILKIYQLVLKLSAKTRFRRPFWILTTKPEVEFSNL